MRKALFAAAAIAGMLIAGSASAIDLRSGMGGSTGYGTNYLSGNDDGSSPNIPLPFQVNFFGNVYNSVFVNNNGNITFNGPVGSYTPTAFPVSSQPMIAPFWGDVDTRCGSCGLTYYAGTLPSPGTTDGRFTVTWNDTGYYSNHSDLTNNFQMTLLERTDTGLGNFDIEFRYDRLTWTTGDASGGAGGFGGTPAQAGYDAGNGVDYFTLPGSRTPGVLQLDDLSNVSADTPGLWYFNIRNGEIADGSSPLAPLVPTIVDPNTGAFQFNFGVAPGQLIYIDPLVATGYDYQVSSGPNIASALFPILPGQSSAYQIFTLDGLTQLGTAMGGSTFNFGAGGVNAFRLLGINPNIALDPSNTLAFVTGLTFVNGGRVAMSQLPLTTFVGGGAGTVPEPATWAMMILGFLGVGSMVRSQRRRTLASA